MPKRVSAPRSGDAFGIVKPEPDSHFRLIPCECGSNNVAYIKSVTPRGDSYQVTCFDCGRTATPDGVASRHAAQMRWNGVMEVAYA